MATAWQTLKYLKKLQDGKIRGFTNTQIEAFKERMDKWMKVEVVDDKTNRQGNRAYRRMLSAKNK